MAASDFTLPEPDTRHMRPERGVVDNSTAQAIKGIGEIASFAGGMALEANKTKRVGALQEDLAELESEVLSQSDQKQVDDFGRKIDKVGLAGKQLGKESQYRVRAEAILKEHMTAAPALSQEFRARASETLGFNPIGSEVAAFYDEQAQAAAADAAHQKQIMALGVANNIHPSRVFTPEGQAELNFVLSQKRKVAEIERGKVLSADAVGALTTTIFVDTSATIDKEVGKIWQDKTLLDLTQEDVLSMDEGVRTQAVNQLTRMKAELRASAVQKFGAGDQTNASLKASEDYIDSVLAFLDPNQDSTRAQNKLKTQEALFKSEMYKDRDIVAAALLYEMTGQVTVGQAAAGLTTKTLKAIGSVVRGQQVDYSTGSDGGAATSWINKLPNESNEEATARFKDTVSITADWMKNASYADAAPNEQALMNKFVTNYTDVLGQTGIKPNQQQAILETLTDPAVVDFIVSLPEGEALFNIVDNTRTYARTSALAAAKFGRETQESFDILGVRGPARRAGFTDQIIGGNTVNVSVRNGVVSVKNTDPRTNVLAAKLRRDYIPRINTSIQAMAAITGTSMEEAAKNVFSKDPSAFSWIEGAEQTQASEGEGQGPTIEAEGTLLQDEEGNMFRVVDGKYVREQ